jgi:cell division protein FtsB
MIMGAPNSQDSASFLRRLPQSERMGRSLKIALWTAGLGLVVYVLLLGEGGWLRVAGLNAEVNELQGKLETLKSQQQTVKDELDDLARPGSLTLEKVARERYGMHRDSEKVLHVLGAGGESLAPKAPALHPQEDPRAAVEGSREQS